MDDTTPTTEDPIEKLAIMIAKGFAEAKKDNQETQDDIAATKTALQSEIAGLKLELIDKLADKRRVDEHELRIQELEKEIA